MPTNWTKPKSICVVGLGYIGLPTASILADHGYQVRGVDVNPRIVDTINRGEIHIHEPGLEELVASVVDEGTLVASLEPAPADVFFLCVPTPFTGDRKPDLSYVRAAARAIKPHVRPGTLIILESTSPPGTTEKVVAAEAIPAGMNIGSDVFLAHCPERVLPGRILIEAIENDRIVGGATSACGDQARRFYETFVTGDVLVSTAIAAECAKLVENSFRDVNIAFANEVSLLAEHLGTDAWEVIRLANRHPRVNILNPGPGVGGHCISVDPWFLVDAAPDQTNLIRTAREVNDAKPLQVVRQVAEIVRRTGAKTVGCLGLAYKADVDDLRESPSLEITRTLRETLTAEVLACEPFVTDEQFTEFPLHGLSEVLGRSEVLVLLTDHTAFHKLSADQLAGKEIVDTRGIWRDKLASKQQKIAA